jgi:RND family efflux transporter MFP subunit
MENSFSGKFEPVKESRLCADIQGKITHFYADLGTVVKKGDPLVQLDNALLKIQLQSSEVQIAGLEADVNRYSVLSKAKAIQGVQLEKAELGLQSAKLQKASLMEQINKTTIRAPFDGIVTAKFSEVGSFAGPGVPLLQLTNISQLNFLISIPETELHKFKMHQSGKLRAAVYPSTALSGTVSMIGSKAIAGNNYQIQFTANNTPDLKIKAGMFGKVEPENKLTPQQILIPASALIGSNENAKVYLVQNQRVVLHAVTVGERFENLILITGGLKPGDVYVTSGFINIYDGAPVTIKNKAL